MTAAIIIPARYASTRLPGKPLLSETGKPLIQYVYENASAAKRASRVIVATDHERIARAVSGFGGEAMMTSGDHKTGTARVAETARTIDADIIVNLQGDEPEIDPGHIDKLIEIAEHKYAFAATLACPFDEDAASGAGSPEDPSAVKAILGEEISPGVRRGRYFTRSVCPYPRDAAGRIENPQRYFLHIGVYAFARENLIRFAGAPSGALEKAERLEQLRILEMGEAIAVGLIDAAPPGVDTQDDYDAFVRRQAGGRLAAPLG